MAKIEKSEESGPQLFFDFTWNYVPKLFLGPPRAEKMTFSQKTGHVWFGDTYFLNPWCLMVNLPYWSPLGTSLKLFCTSRPMWRCLNIARLKPMMHQVVMWSKYCVKGITFMGLTGTEKWKGSKHVWYEMVASFSVPLFSFLHKIKVDEIFILTVA